MERESYAILVVDDEEPIRRLLQKELATDNRAVLVAGDALEAMETLACHEIDVVVMDLRIPGVTDLELLIKVKDSMPHVEVVMISGHSDSDIAARAMALGAYDFFHKPFNLEQLDLQVENAHRLVQLTR